uniref:uncharacterized protein LOC124063759 isoform X4 n=1 Tax=Scatophagus argus TaxID=75038 RepID=UPI001ED8022B|nr:uncharacterized protein LOC124063759 isoform X4 [Scatophagus argus]
MDSSPVLRQQSQNKIHSDFLRMKNEHNKMPVHPKASKLLSAPHLSNHDNENKNPGSSEMGRKAPVRPGVSRLPVLAKSLSLQTPSDFGQTHRRWEEKPLAGKAKKKKPCTRPIPFNLSQPKSSKMATENQQAIGISQSRTGSHAVQPGNNAAFNPEACLDNMNLLSLKDPTGTSHDRPKMQLTAQGNFSKSSADKGANFQPDHAALLSILRDEGVSATGLGSATPQCKPYNYLPQRVSVMKSRQKAGTTTGSIKSVQFSPDSAALQSILQNEGVKVGGPVGATPRSSVRPSGRGTSIYTAQRVPARKNRVEVTGESVALELKESPQKKWTPQRVRNTRHQPISAMVSKWHVSTPYTGTPGLRSCKANLQPRQEEVVQRLFEDQEDEQNTDVADKDPETQAEQLPVQATAFPSSFLQTKPHSEEKLETSRANSSEEEDQRIVGGQPFIQAPHRESVIFFSTGKKLLRAPRFEQQESSAHHEQHGPGISEQRKVLPAHLQTPSVSEPTCQIKPSVQSLHRDLIVQKTCAVSSAVALLRKRLPPLEELRMDEEVATYTSASVPAAPGFLPPRPRCGNPLASILHFEESSRFIPIGCDLSSDPPSPPSSPLQER